MLGMSLLLLIQFQTEKGGRSGCDKILTSSDERLTVVLCQNKLLPAAAVGNSI